MQQLSLLIDATILRTLVEGTGQEGDWTRSLTEKQRNQMFENSPIAHVEKVSKSLLFELFFHNNAYNFSSTTH